jgi:hypothetical protein
MILWLRYKVFPETGRVSVIDIHLNYVHSINLEKVTA